VFTDPTLIVESLVEVMEKIMPGEGRRSKVWWRVLEWKHVTPSSCFDEVYKKYTTAKEKTRALADVYVNSRPESSWRHLVQTLYIESEMAAAKEARPFLQHSRGTNSLPIFSYMYICIMLGCAIEQKAHGVQLIGVDRRCLQHDK
jgi:hypothetical protein